MVIAKWMSGAKQISTISVKTKSDVFRLHFTMRKILVESGNNITVDIINTALGNNVVVTEGLLDLCKRIYNESRIYDLPWSKDMASFSQFTKVHGPMSAKTGNKVPGVYILWIAATNDSYVGQSIRLSLRIKQHIYLTSTSTKFVLEVLKTDKSGKVQTCIVDDKTEQMLLREHGVPLASFLDILEQYIILLIQPTLNKLYVVRHGGVLCDRSIDSGGHPLSRRLYIYKIVQKCLLQATLIYELPTIGSLGRLLGINPDFVRDILKRDGFIRDSIYCTTTPLENVTTSLMKETTFIKYFKQVIDMPHRSSPKALYMVDVLTNEKKGPYPSATYISKYVLPNADRISLKPNRSSPYRGRYYFEYVEN